jgi:hypothetical protein
MAAAEIGFLAGLVVAVAELFKGVVTTDEEVLGLGGLIIAPSLRKRP